MKLPKGLVFVTDALPGCARRRYGRGFAYFDPKGKRITQRAEIQCFNALAVPPAYRRVWLCPDPRGHLQSTGYDARGRKQYRYHLAYRAFRDARKFDRMPAFGEALGAIRRAVNRDLQKTEPGDKRYATALVVKLLDRTGFRIGNEAYLRENKTRGLLTLTERNLTVEEAAARMEFDFKTKGGKRISRTLTNRRLASRINRLQELPGQRVFIYRNMRGEMSGLHSEDVNEYVSEIAGDNFTAKDFRTWIGTREAAGALVRAEVDDRAPDQALAVAWKAALQAAAEALGNTIAVARRAYVHPAIGTLEALHFFSARMARGSFEPRPQLSKLETALIAFLDKSGNVGAAKRSD